MAGEAVSPDTEVEVAFTAPVFGPGVGALAVHLDAWLEQPGFVTVWRDGARPWTTSLFADAASAGRTAGAIVATSGDRFRLVATSAGYVGVGVNGYFTA